MMEAAYKNDFVVADAIQEQIRKAPQQHAPKLALNHPLPRWLASHHGTKKLHPQSRRPFLVPRLGSQYFAPRLWPDDGLQ
jgi:hypothetical protein